jgi:hypothetical protein
MFAFDRPHLDALKIGLISLNKRSLIGRCVFALMITSIVFLLNACATDPHGQATISIPTHGTFCGPKHPVIHNKTKTESVIELMTIKPLDDIDAACRRHDICYEVAGYFNLTCDAWLTSEVQRINLRYLDKNQQMYCTDIQFGLVSPGKIAFERTPKDSRRNPIVVRLAGGYAMAGVVISLDAASTKLDKIWGTTAYICNNRQQ